MCKQEEYKQKAIEHDMSDIPAVDLEKVEEGAESAYQKMEDGVVGGYKKIETGVVEGHFATVEEALDWLKDEVNI